MIKVYKDRTLVEGINLALKHRLYVSGWTLSGELTYTRRIAETKNIDALVVLHFAEDVPVSIVFVDQQANVAAFTHVSHRRRGIGSKLLRTAYQTVGSKLSADYGIRGSDRFWQQHEAFVSYYSRYDVDCRG